MIREYMKIWKCKFDENIPDDEQLETNGTIAVMILFQICFWTVSVVWIATKTEMASCPAWNY